MENYIINNKTIAIMKQKNKTIIYDVENYRVINKNIKRILNYNCNIYGSSFDGRKKSAQMLLKIHYKVPLIITNNLILIQLSSIRKEECLFLVLNKIIDYKCEDKLLRIKCSNNQIFEVYLSKNSFEKMLINAVKLTNILKWQKIQNFV